MIIVIAGLPGAWAWGLGCRSMVDTMAAFRDITGLTLTLTATAHITALTVLGMAATTQPSPITITASSIVGMTGQRLRGFNPDWREQATTRVRSTASWGRVLAMQFVLTNSGTDCQWMDELMAVC